MDDLEIARAATLDPKLRGAPEGHTVTVEDVRLSAGAVFKTEYSRKL